jgi:predicted permease
LPIEPDLTPSWLSGYLGAFNHHSPIANQQRITNRRSPLINPIEEATGMWQDIKHGIRVLLKSPGFTSIAILSIAIGVGANAAMFSVADGLVFRPLPVPRASEVVSIIGLERNVGFGNRRLSYPDYVDLRDRTKSFRTLVAYTTVVTTFADRADALAQRKVGAAVTGNLLEAMEVPAALGRTFRADEDQVPGRNPVVILDYDEWTQEYSADPAIVDRRIYIGGVEFTVIGVTPPGFTGIDHDVKPSFYVPTAMYTAVQNGVPRDVLTRRELRNFVVKGRLAPGVTQAEAGTDVQQLASSLAQTYPETSRNRDLLVRTQLQAYRDQPNGGDTNLVVMLMTLAFVVLAIACANLAGLLASRAPVRAREVALRMAVGAGRWRVVRQLVTESLILAATGGLLGLVISYLIINVFRTVEYPTDIPLKLTFELDARAIAVAIVLATGSAILTSLLPAWRAARADLVRSLKDTTGENRGRARQWGRSVLVCGQVAASLVLLAVAMFMYRAFQTQLDQGPGFRTQGLLFASFDPGLARYDNARTEAFYRLLKDRAQALPGVQSVTLASNVPMRTDNLQFSRLVPEGFQLAQGIESITSPSNIVDDGYFDTTGIRIVEGRGFRATDDRDSPSVVVVNQQFASHYWPGQSAIGKRVRVLGERERYVEIIGVAANSKQFFIAERPVEFVYFAHEQSPPSRRSLMLASNQSAEALAEPVRAMVRSIDPGMPVLGLRTMEDYYDARAVGIARLLVGTIGGMGTIGVVLAMVGLYGLMAYAVSRRTREFGIRIAVGAEPSSVLGMVLKKGMLLAGAGIVIGVIASIGADGLLQAVFESQMSRTTNIGAYVSVVTALVIVTLLAAYLPARRAARTDPLRALRQE